MLQCTLAGLAVAEVPALLRVNDKSAREMKSRVDHCRAEYGEGWEKLIALGSCRYAEAGAAAFREAEVAGSLGTGEGELEDALARAVAREQWAGIAERGRP